MGSRDQELVTLGRGRTTLHASARKSIAVWVRPRETVRQCFQKFDDLALLLIRQAKIRVLATGSYSTTSSGSNLTSPIAPLTWKIKPTKAKGFRRFPLL
jgi:hypothetical protein